MGGKSDGDLDDLLQLLDVRDDENTGIVLEEDTDRGIDGRVRMGGIGESSYFKDLQPCSVLCRYEACLEFGKRCKFQGYR